MPENEGRILRKEENMREDKDINYTNEFDNNTETDDFAAVGMAGGKHKIKYMLHVDSLGGKAFWGALFLLGAVALIAGQLGYLNFAGFSFWTIIWTLFFVGIFLESIVKASVGNALFSLAFLVIIHDEMLGLEAITPWPVLGAALLGTIGIKMIFPKLGRHNKYIEVNGVRYKKGESYSEETRNGDKISYENAFGEAVKYVSGDVSVVNVENAFGSTQVYFTDAFPMDGKLKIQADNAFGNVTLYIPGVWKVFVKTESFCGNVREKGRCSLDGLNEVYINADTVFGGIEIRYI